MVGIEVFLMKPKHQFHLLQWVEWVYVTQSWKERRLLCVSVFVLIDKQTLIQKNGEKTCFSYKIKASMLFIPMKGMSLCFPIKKRKKIVMRIHVYQIW